MMARGTVAAVAMLFMVGCTGEKLEGFVWGVTATTGTFDPESCGYDWQGFEETFEYRLVYDGAAVDLAIGDDIFATGHLSGCQVAYESVVWGSEVDGAEVRWQLLGDATFRPGGASCNLDDGVDWVGSEIFEIVHSEHEQLNAGCWFSLTTSGVYRGVAADL